MWKMSKVSGTLIRDETCVASISQSYGMIDIFDKEHMPTFVKWNSQK